MTKDKTLSRPLEEDAGIRNILLWGATILALIIVVVCGLKVFVANFTDDSRIAFPVARIPEGGRRLVSRFPAPRLQVSPQAELQALRTKQLAALHEAKWVDPEAGTVKIPIETAMDLYLSHLNGEPKK